MARVAHIYGKKLAAARNRLAMTQKELGEAIGGVSDETISRVERQDVSGILAKRLPKLAAVLGLGLEQFKSAFCPPDAPQPSETFSRKISDESLLPAGIDMFQSRPARLLPEFPVGIAASRRVDKMVDYSETDRPVDTADQRAFAAPVDGDCQAPKWRHGEVVIFSYDAVEREGILPGNSYYIAFTDGSTTFKRVFLDESNPDIYLLRCWNRKKYPKDQPVPRDEVVRIARAISKQVEVDESESGNNSKD
jgi:transcriptional regulator with XRE-family HTH domain